MPPVARTSDNVFRLLKPGGLFILTVPFGTQPKTIEHFPELHDFQIVETDGKYVLTNVTREDVVQRFDRLVFHGGPGMTLEMRVFAECDLIKHLAAAGFLETEVHRNPLFQYGIWWAGHARFRFRQESRRIALKNLSGSSGSSGLALTVRALPTGLFSPAIAHPWYEKAVTGIYPPRWATAFTAAYVVHPGFVLQTKVDLGGPSSSCSSCSSSRRCVSILWSNGWKPPVFSPGL